MRIILSILILLFIGFLTKKLKRNKLRAARGGVAFVPDDSKWNDEPEKFGRDYEHPIVVNNPEDYLGSIVNENGKHITWKVLPVYKKMSENFEFETLEITPYLIFVDEIYDGKLFFHVCDATNSKNTPEGYTFGEKSNDRTCDVSMNFCPYCGFELPQEIKFCPKCGKRLEETTASVIK